MTHVNNYQYVKKWREHNPEIKKQRARQYQAKYILYKTQIQLLLNIDPTLFL
jgi:hypothetical protein